MRIFFLKVWLIFLAILFFVSCKEKLSNNTIAKIDEIGIPVKEFSDILSLNPYPGSTINEEEFKRRVLSALIAQKILAQEAKKNKHLLKETNPYIQQYKNEATIEAFWDDQIFSRVEISEKELKSAYFKSKQKRIVEYIKFNSFKEASNFYKIYSKTNDFYLAAIQIGMIPDNVPVDTLEYDGKLPDIEEAVFQMELDQVSSPIKQGRNYYLFKLNAVKKDIFTAEDDFNIQKNKLEKQLKTIKTLRFYETYKKENLNNFDYQLDKKVFKWLTLKISSKLFSDSQKKLLKKKNITEQFFSDLDDKEVLNKKIVSFADKSIWSIEMFLEKLKTASYPLDFSSKTKFETSFIVAAKHILDDEVILKKSIELGLDKSEQVSIQTNMWASYLLSNKYLRNNALNENDTNDSDNIENRLFDISRQYHIQINTKLYKSLRIEPANMFVLKEHFPGRTIVPSVSPYINLKKWQSYIESIIYQTN